MSTKILRLLGAALITFGLVGPATAGGRVDWSDYIDRNPSKPVTVAPAVAKEDPPARSKTKASKAKKKTAKAKAKARKKKSRR
jgi:ribosomal protein L12E/L44/L45/RPP1/RPP2